jgi:small GTP-binding protein
MIQKKICMLGSFAVGKTSLVARFVTSTFSDKYLTTVGVKIDKKTTTVDGIDLSLILWDIYGEDEFQKLRLSYLRGAAGFLLVVDGTRRATWDAALGLHQKTTRHIGPLPFVICLNKADLRDRWEVDTTAVRDLAAAAGWPVLETIAKTGAGVEEAFRTLGARLLAPQGTT